MNYRHGFHAGNFADCVKHALVLAILTALLRKPAPIAVLDTHAGAGRYDLGAEPSTRTGEWQSGIGRLLADPPPPLAPYIELVNRLGLYPGSPLLIAALLRAQDRLICCELHPEEHGTLKALMGGNKRVFVHRRDGYEAIRALLPPSERRGLVLIDPPFERGDEFTALAEAMAVGTRRFPGGVFAAWYPLKHRAPSRRFEDELAARGLNDVMAAEFRLRAPLDPLLLNGCVLAVVNPPFRFVEEASAILAALSERLCPREAGAGWTLRRIAAE